MHGTTLDFNLDAALETVQKDGIHKSLKVLQAHTPEEIATQPELAVRAQCVLEATARYQRQEINRLSAHIRDLEAQIEQLRGTVEYLDQQRVWLDARN